MKKSPFLCLALLLFCSHPLPGRAAVENQNATAFTPTEPEITALRGRIVRVRVPAGFDRVTLQVLATPHVRRTSSPAARPAWKTAGINYPRKAGKVVEFRLDRLTPRRFLRVLGAREETLAGDLLTGITSFFPDASPINTATNGNLTVFPHQPGAMSPDGSITNSAVHAMSPGFSSTGAITETRAVAEADIWKVDGDRLYFFNERRGLQVFDLHTPDDPALLGTLRMPAMGEDMYLLDAEHVALLKKSWSWYWGEPLSLVEAGAPAESFTLTADSAAISAAQLTIAPQRQANGLREIVIADVKDGQPRVVGRVEFEGTVRESRLVGKVLYLATDSFRPAIAGGQPQWGLEVTSFDLHDPAHPVRRASLHLGGWANAVSANERTLLVAKWSTTGGTAIDILDISDPNGAMTRGGSVSVAGSVQDKFKLREAGGVLTVVSQKWRDRTRAEIDALLNLPANIRPPDFISASSVGITAVNTFSLADPAAPVALGSLDLALDETLHATRFDGDRLYVITAQHRPWIHLTYIWDPLWIVDLADPAQPKVLGELEMPGFSTYIEPLDDRLVTIGLVEGKPTVSLFDIADAAKPAQLSRVVLDGGQWINSAAVWNEKAFSVLPDENLILMPLSISNYGGGSIAGVQLLDLFRDRVVKRGLVPQPIEPRRATVHRGRIVAIAPGHLLTIDATNRDTPRITADVEIAWQVDRVFAIGGHLVQLGSQWRNGNTYDLTLTVTPSDNPDETLDTLTLTGAPLAEVTLRDGVLYLLQIKPGESSWDPNTQTYRETAPSRVTLSAVNVARLPRLGLYGKVTVEVPNLDLGNYWIGRTPSYDGWGASGVAIWNNPQYGRDSSTHALWINETTLGFSRPGGGREYVSPYWNDPPPYDLVSTEWVPNPDAPSVDAVAIQAGSTAIITIDQIYIGKARGHYVTTKLGTVDKPGRWEANHVYRTAQRVLAFDVRNPARMRFASDFELGGDEPWDVAPPVAVDGALLASYQHLGPLLTAEKFAASATGDPETFARKDLTRRGGLFLATVDYSDPAKPHFSPDQPNLPGTLIGATGAGKILFTTGQSYDPLSGKAGSLGTVLHASALAGSVVHLLDQLPLANWQTPLLRGRTVFQFKAEPAKIWVPNNEPPPAGYGDEIGGITVRLGLNSFATSGAPAVLNRPYWSPGTYEDNPKKSTLTTWELGADGKFAQLATVELDRETTFHLFGNLGVVFERANQPRLLDFTDPAAIRILGYHSFEGAPQLNYPFADGAVGSGLWIPAGAYGVESFTFPK